MRDRYIKKGPNCLFMLPTKSIKIKTIRHCLVSLYVIADSTKHQKRKYSNKLSSTKFLIYIYVYIDKTDPAVDKERQQQWNIGIKLGLGL